MFLFRTSPLLTPPENVCTLSGLYTLTVHTKMEKDNKDKQANSVILPSPSLQATGIELQLKNVYDNVLCQWHGSKWQSGQSSALRLSTRFSSFVLLRHSLKRKRFRTQGDCKYARAYL